MRFNLRRWSVFNIVGIGGFILQIGTIAVLTRVFAWTPLAATAVALELAAFHNFIGHNRITWNDRPPQSAREWLARYLRYQVAKTTSLAASFVITLIVMSWTRIPTEAASTIAVMICALPNYLLTERLVFSKGAP